MSTTKLGNLEIQIEELVRGHIAALRASVTLAVERAFERSSTRAVKASRSSIPAAKVSLKRRQPHEMDAMADRLYAVICAHPGAAMTLLAAEIGASPRELHRPAQHLKRAGRVRTIGQRHGMRYFPMTSKSVAARA
jgi:hypothetical protein